MQISKISQNNNFSNLQAKSPRTFSSQPSSVNFTGGLPKSNFFEPLAKAFEPVTSAFGKMVGGIAIGYGKLLNTKFAHNVIEGTEKTNVVNHISAAIGLIVSGTYISRTLKNKKMDPDQKITLAINNGIVAVVSTVMGYTVSKVFAKTVDKFVRKYTAVNYRNPNIKTLRFGAAAAASMVIFSMMYRYVSPVLVTPIANTLGNRILANKKAEADALAKGKTQTKAPATPAPPVAATTAPVVAAAPPIVKK